jgi:hypothetical protein
MRRGARRDRVVCDEIVQRILDDAARLGVRERESRIGRHCDRIRRTAAERVVRMALEKGSPCRME